MAALASSTTPVTTPRDASDAVRGTNLNYEIGWGNFLLIGKNAVGDNWVPARSIETHERASWPVM